MKDIVIIGAGGFGREVLWLIHDINKIEIKWNILGFVDDNPNLQGREIDGYPVLGTIDWLISEHNLNMVLAIADPGIRFLIANKLIDRITYFPNLIHPSVIYSPTIRMGVGNIICAGCIISVNVKLSNFIIIDWKCTIGHDVVIDEMVTLFPSVNVSGFCRIENLVSIGTGSQIIPNVEIGKKSVIGAGSVVVRNLKGNNTYVGVPVRSLY